MKTNLLRPFATGTLAVALLALNAAAVRGEIEDTLSRSFAVQPGGQLVVQIDRGSIEITTAESNSVAIDILRQTDSSRAKADQIFKDHVVTMTQDGNRVTVQAEYRGAKRSGWFDRGDELHVKALIRVPRHFDVDLKTAGGSVQVTQLAGRLQAKTSGGSLRFEKIDGPILGKTSGGSITVAGCNGPVEVSSSGGSLHLSDIQGDLDARTSGGAIHAEQLTGSSILRTSGGGIRISGVRGKTEAATSGGSISVQLPEQPSGDCSFKTSGGSITLSLGEKVAVDIDAHTSAGKVTSDFPVATTVQGEQKNHELHGKINGGGPLLTAHTSAGSVRLQKD
jgi:DUF4097 and DUF4098 domain-containing protein YvlB